MKKGTVKWIAIAVVVIVILLLWKSCKHGICIGCNRETPSPVVVHDTLYQIDYRDTSYVPELKIAKPLKIKNGNWSDTLYVPDNNGGDIDTSIFVTGDLIFPDPDTTTGWISKSDYKRLFVDGTYYSDTLQVRQGEIIIQDTISENKITSRRVITQFSLPTIRETVTITRPERNVLYLGFSAQGSKQNYFYSLGADISLKSRNERIWTIGGNLTRDNQLLYEAGVKFPIRLKK